MRWPTAFGRTVYLTSDVSANLNSICMYADLPVKAVLLFPLHQQRGCSGQASFCTAAILQCRKREEQTGVQLAQAGRYR